MPPVLKLCPESGHGWEARSPNLVAPLEEPLPQHGGKGAIVHLKGKKRVGWGDSMVDQPVIFEGPFCTTAAFGIDPPNILT